MIRALLLASLLLSPLVASSETQARVEPGERRTITAHGVCRQVTNGNGTPVMIPLSTPQEWSQGGSAFLAAPRPGMTVESCTRDIWAWEYMTGTAVFWQGPSMTDYGAGGLEVQTRFTQYTGNPSSYLNLIPPAAPGRGESGSRSSRGPRARWRSTCSTSATTRPRSTRSASRTGR